MNQRGFWLPHNYFSKAIQPTAVFAKATAQPNTPLVLSSINILPHKHHISKALL
jgi:hypothetical protein